MADDSGETDRLLAAAGRGNTADWGDLLDRHRARLRRMLALRPDHPPPGRGEPPRAPGRGPRQHGGLGRPAGPPPRPPAADARPAAGPPPPGAGGPVRRPARNLPRGDAAAGRLPPPAGHAVLPVAAVPGRAA